jgi:GNAT superfamily N-acetyltransferase
MVRITKRPLAAMDLYRLDFRALIGQLTSRQVDYTVLEAALDDPNLIAWVLEEIDHGDRRIVGYGSFSHYPSLEGNAGVLEDLAVHPEYQEAGFGGDLYDHLEGILIRCDTREAWLTCDPHRLKARCLCTSRQYRLTDQDSYEKTPSVPVRLNSPPNGITFRQLKDTDGKALSRLVEQQVEAFDWVKFESLFFTHGFQHLVAMDGDEMVGFGVCSCYHGLVKGKAAVLKVFLEDPNSSSELESYLYSYLEALALARKANVALILASEAEAKRIRLQNLGYNPRKTGVFQKRF